MSSQPSWADDEGNGSLPATSFRDFRPASSAQQRSVACRNSWAATESIPSKNALFVRKQPVDQPLSEMSDHEERSWGVTESLPSTSRYKSVVKSVSSVNTEDLLTMNARVISSVETGSGNCDFYQRVENVADDYDDHDDTEDRLTDPSHSSVVDSVISERYWVTPSVDAADKASRSSASVVQAVTAVQATPSTNRKRECLSTNAELLTREMNGAVMGSVVPIV
jgi:hypothetical protein